MRRRVLLKIALYITELFLLAIAGTLFIISLNGCQKQINHSPSLPMVLTFDELNVITSTSAQCKGQVTSDGGSEVTDRGFCWNTSPLPDTSNHMESCGRDTGVFTFKISGLTPFTVYYLRAYATNSAGTIYGGEVNFITLLFSLPVILTKPVNNIIETTASSGGLISSDGSAYITKRGVCWSTSPGPTIFNDKTTDGSGVNEFTSNMQNLSGSTLYYLRAYATNAAGTAYGDELNFTTLETALPKITTSPVINVISKGAVSGGTINIGTSVNDRGICWSTHHLPTKSDYILSNGDGTGNFSCSMSNLASQTVYYVRAFATNKAGTAFGNEVSFTSAMSGNITYTLAKDANPTAEQLNAYELIKIAMDSAMFFYNTYTTFTKNIAVYYVPGVATADGSNNGTIRFGSDTYYMNVGTAMHETAHTLGVGTNSSWTTLVVGGVYTGTNAISMLRSLTGDPAAILYGDNMHFWPYGLNYPTEIKSSTDLVDHCKIVEAMKMDGL